MKATAKLSYGPLTFSAELPAKKIPEHPKPVFSFGDLHKLEQAAALWVIERGIMLPETLRLLRAGAGLTGVELARLLDTDKETVSRWEHGKQRFNTAIWNTVADLALDAIQGRTTTRDRLLAMQQAQIAAPREVKLSA